MKIFVSAAEISSDLQAEKILRELILLYPAGTVQIAGIGGPRLRALPKFQTVEPAENLRAMGFTEVLGKLLSIRKVLKNTLRFLDSYQPDLIITFDYPDFHFTLLKACAKNPNLNQAIKICGIPPKIWVWRGQRIKTIQKLYDAVWVLFPFERDLYENASIPVVFEGNPLIGEVLKELPAQKPEWITKDQIRLAVMPGSREAEIAKHLKVIPRTLELLSQKCEKKIIAEVPVPTGVPISSITEKLKDSAHVSYRISEDSSATVLAQNTLGLIKSGTSTLEAAVLGCVPVIFYRVSFLTRLIFQFLIRYSGAVGLPNILLNVKDRREAIFPEFLGPEATPEALSDELFKFIHKAGLIEEKQKVAESLREMLVPHKNIPAKIAVHFKAIVDKGIERTVARKSSGSIAVTSFLWSSVNALRRKLYLSGMFNSKKISLPSVLVGNLQAGGAGKTPVVIALAKEAIRQGYRVGVVSRGYGGQFKESCLIVNSQSPVETKLNARAIGDEPVEILSEVPEVTLGLGSDRVANAKKLESLGINYLIFDDGFQNLKFKTSKTVLLVTDANPNEVIFRDFFGAHRHADFVFQLKGAPKPAPIPATVLKWEVESLPEGPVWLMCGVADPSEVAQFYRNLGVEISKVIALSDHAEFDSQQVKAWQNEAKQSGATLAVTAKDWTKLKSDSSLTLFILKRKISSQGWLEPIIKR